MTWRSANNARAMRAVYGRERANRPLEIAISWIAAIVVVLFALAMSFAVISVAYGHEWYPPLCCSGGDCGPINPSRVMQLDGGGFIIDGKFYIPRSEAGPSLDGRYHACFPTPAELKCFFAPLREG